MKILKNIGRKNKIIKELRKAYTFQWNRYRQVTNTIEWLKYISEDENKEIEKLKIENKELLEIKDKYYNLITNIKINEQLLNK